MNENQIYQQMYKALEAKAREVLHAYDSTNPDALGLAIQRLQSELDAVNKTAKPIINADLRTHPRELLQELTLKQPSELKASWYQRAKDEGIISNCYAIGRHLGEKLNDSYGPKYGWKQDGVKIYVDDYGGYMSVDYQGKCVCSTHTTSGLFVAGEWINIIDGHIENARGQEQAKALAREEDKRRRLLNSLF